MLILCFVIYLTIPTVIAPAENSITINLVSLLGSGARKEINLLQNLSLFPFYEIIYKMSNIFTLHHQQL